MPNYKRDGRLPYLMTLLKPHYPGYQGGQLPVGYRKQLLEFNRCRPRFSFVEPRSLTLDHSPYTLQQGVPPSRCVIVQRVQRGLRLPVDRAAVERPVVLPDVA